MAEIRLFVKYDNFSIEVSDLEALEREKRYAKKIGAEIVAIEVQCYEDSSELFGTGKLLATKQIG
jgi:hypothetical protein